MGGASGQDRGGPEQRRAQRVLAMVGELHKRGYQGLRVSPGYSGSGGYWRCMIAPRNEFSAGNGAILEKIDDAYVAKYTSGDGNSYFGWQDAASATARWLADLFVERFPAIAARSELTDWPYAGWFVEILGHSEAGRFPVAYQANEWISPQGAETISLFPWFDQPGEPTEVPAPPRPSVGDSPH